jgi:TP901 family phage tail tape measure protein
MGMYAANEKLSIIIEGIDNISGVLQNIEAKIGSVTRSVERSSSAFSVAGGIIISQFANRLTSGFSQVTTESANMAMSFERTLQTMTAMTGRTGDAAVEFTAEMSELAKTMGVDFGVGANEATYALEQLVRAGFDPAADGGDALAAALKLVAIEGVDAGEAARILATSIYAFGEEQSRANEFVDDFVRASSMGVDTASGYASGLTNVAATASSLGFSFEDTIATLVILDQRFGNAVEGGTYLNNMLIQLSKNSEDYGVELYDVNGNLNSFDNIIGQLRDNYNALLPDQAAANEYLSQFNIRAQYAVRTLVNYDGTVAGVRDQLDEMGGAQEIVNAALDTASGRYDIAQARLQELEIEIGATTAEITVMWKEFAASLGPVGAFADAIGPGALQGVMNGLIIAIASGRLELGGLAKAFTDPAGTAALLSTKLGGLATGLTAILGPIAAVAAAFGGLVLLMRGLVEIWNLYADAVGLTDIEVQKGAASFEYLTQTVDDYNMEAEELRLITEGQIDPMERLGIVVEDVARQEELLAMTQQELLQGFQDGTVGAGEYAWAISELNTNLGDVETETEGATTSTSGYNEEIDSLIRRSGLASTEVETLGEKTMDAGKWASLAAEDYEGFTTALSDTGTEASELDMEMEMLVRRGGNWYTQASDAAGATSDLANSMNDAAWEASLLTSEIEWLGFAIDDLNDENDVLNIALMENSLAQRNLKKEIEEATDQYGKCSPQVKELTNQLEILEDEEWDLRTATIENTIELRKLMYIQGELKERSGEVADVLERLENEEIDVTEAQRLLGIESDTLAGILQGLQDGTYTLDEAFQILTGDIYDTGDAAEETGDDAETAGDQIAGMGDQVETTGDQAETTEGQMEDLDEDVEAVGTDADTTSGKLSTYDTQMETTGWKAGLLAEDLQGVEDEFEDITEDAGKAKTAINSIPSSKTVTVTTKYQSTGTPPPGAGRYEGGDKPYQRAFHRAVQFRESENVRVHPGEWIMGPPALQRLLASVMEGSGRFGGLGGGGGGGVQIHVTVTGNNINSQIDLTSMGRQVGKEIVHRLRAEGLWWIGR